MRTTRHRVVLDQPRNSGGMGGVRGRRNNAPAPPVFHAFSKIKAAVPKWVTAAWLRPYEKS